MLLKQACTASQKRGRLGWVALQTQCWHDGFGKDSHGVASKPLDFGAVFDSDVFVVDPSICLTLSIPIPNGGGGGL